MTLLLPMFALLAVLSTPFVDAEGAAVDDSVGVVVEITVTVDQAFEAVLVRPFSSYDELPPTALVSQEDGTWSGFVTFPTATNWSMVFDGLESGGEAFRSDLVTLIEIGVDPVVVAGDPIKVPSRPMDPETWWLIGGVAFALAALGALAYWTFGSDTTVPE